MVNVEFKMGKLPKDEVDKLKYLYRLKEILRLYHNEQSKNYKDGKITLAAFRKFQKTWFKPRNFLVCETINNCKNAMVEDTSIICSIDDIEET